MTKALTAVAVGGLVAEGKAKWDVPVSEYLPEFQLKDPRLTAEINFVALLAHRTVCGVTSFLWTMCPKFSRFFSLFLNAYTFSASSMLLIFRGFHAETWTGSAVPRAALSPSSYWDTSSQKLPCARNASTTTLCMPWQARQLRGSPARLMKNLLSTRCFGLWTWRTLVSLWMRWWPSIPTEPCLTPPSPSRMPWREMLLALLWTLSWNLKSCRWHLLQRDWYGQLVQGDHARGQVGWQVGAPQGNGRQGHYRLEFDDTFLERPWFQPYSIWPWLGNSALQGSPNVAPW